MKKLYPSWNKILHYLLLFIVGLLLGYYLGYDHAWEKHIQTPYTTEKPTTTPSCDAVTIMSPQPGSKITSPLTVTVKIDNTKSCRWTVFEAQAGVISLQDGTGRKIGSASLTTSENWMTEEPVIYTGIIEFGQTPTSSDLLLEIIEEKPQGLGPEENGKSVTIPLTY